MITLEDLDILDPTEYSEEVDCFIIKEKNKQQKFKMELKVNITDKKIINLFHKRLEGRSIDDNTRLLFLKYKNFPDGVYIEVEDDQIICHIIELKKTPRNQLQKIGNQLLVAKLHLISIFSILGKNLNNISYKYYIAFSTDEQSKLEKHNLAQPYRKVISGTPAPDFGKVRLWDQSIITSNMGNYQFRERVEKIQLEQGEPIGDYEVFIGEYFLA